MTLPAPPPETRPTVAPGTRVVIVAPSHLAAPYLRIQGAVAEVVEVLNTHIRVRVDGGSTGSLFWPEYEVLE